MKNRIIIAVAGSGKTTKIIREALNKAGSRILIVTYTINNINEIKKKFYIENGHIPSNVTILSWFRFLLFNFVKPYRNFLYNGERIQLVNFEKSPIGIKKSNISKYYLDPKKAIYSDKISEFSFECNTISGGLSINRLEDIYDYIYIDEAQDLAGYDLEIIQALFQSKIAVTLVGDHRQSTFQTHYPKRNRQYTGFRIIEKFKNWEKQGICSIEYLQTCIRSNQAICDIADLVYPDLPKTISVNNFISDHDGFFILPQEEINNYISKYAPKVLRYNIKTNCFGYEAINYGDSKGLTFDRVLIIPHNPLRKFVKTGDSKHILNSSKIYVAFTRAIYSVAIVYNGDFNLEIFKKWSPALT